MSIWIPDADERHCLPILDAVAGHGRVRWLMRIKLDGHLMPSHTFSPFIAFKPDLSATKHISEETMLTKRNFLLQRVSKQG